MVLVVVRCTLCYPALYTFLPLVVTVTINSLISVSLISRETEQDRAGCASCRLQGGACEAHQDWVVLSREKDKLDKLLKMKTVRMTVLTAFGFLLCQVRQPASQSDTDHLRFLRFPPPYSGSSPGRAALGGRRTSSSTRC